MLRRLLPLAPRWLEAPRPLHMTQGALWSLGLACLLLLAGLPNALAFCGFFVSGADAKLYNNASQVVLLRKGNHTEMSMSNNYQGPPEDFAMVVPVPVVLKKEQVKTLPPNVFARIDALSAPRLVEYWEQDPYTSRASTARRRARDADADMEGAADEEKILGRHGVKIEAKFEVGEYQIVILSAKDSGDLTPGCAKIATRFRLVPPPPWPLSARPDEVLRRQGRHQEGQARQPWLRRAVAAALRLRRAGSAAAGAPGPAQCQRQAGPAHLHPASREALRGRQLPQRLYPHQHRSRRRGAQGLAASTPSSSTRRCAATTRRWSPSTPGRLQAVIPSAAAAQSLDVYMFGDESMSGRLQSMDGDDEGGYYGDPVPYVLTRLHTRYDKNTLSDDLIFREAKPVVGDEPTMKAVWAIAEPSCKRAARTTFKAATSSATTGPAPSPA